MFCKVLIFLAISLLVASNEGEVFLVSISTKQYCLGRRLNYFTGNNKLTIGSSCLIADVRQSSSSLNYRHLLKTQGVRNKFKLLFPLGGFGQQNTGFQRFINFAMHR